MIECLCRVKIELLLLEALWAIRTCHPAMVEERQVVRTIILPCKRLYQTAIDYWLYVSGQLVELIH